jgi:CubicO group peptidase (beta-lactamase class C family)
MGAGPQGITLDPVAPESIGLSADRLKRIDTAMQRYVDRGQLAGLITVLVRHGKPAHFGVYGQMDIAARKPMRADAIFRIFSMTKPLTSMAVLMLYEEGAFHLQHPVSMFLPAFNDLKVLAGRNGSGMELVPLERSITIHDLLTHTSGLGYGLDASTTVNSLYQQATLLRPDESMADKVDRMVNIPLHHQPGKCYTYSLGTDVLGRIVEVVSGVPLDEFFQRRIFEPLGMVDTDFYVPADKLPRLATLYTPAPTGGLLDVASLPSDPLQFPFGLWTDKSVKPAFLSGGGGLVSTTADYLRFGMLMRNKGQLDGVRLLSRKTVELMTAPHLRPEQFFISGASYGLGVTVLTSPAQAQMLGSVGAYEAGGAANTLFWVDPQEDMVGLLMVQYIHTSPSMVGMDFKCLAEQAIVD